ncbi:MAG: hypothetical protein LBD88_04580 [Candidatus Peribacteria bacterium]|jgi:hypothetical protein|nr:hypothetical protein [Candidatus Peribacteria bacterium]
MQQNLKLFKQENLSLNPIIKPTAAYQLQINIIIPQLTTPRKQVIILNLVNFGLKFGVLLKRRINATIFIEA